MLIPRASPAHAQDAPGAIPWPEMALGLPERVVSFLGNPALEVGTATGPEYTLFSGVVGATRLTGGGIAVGDASTARVLFFDSSGEFLNAFGRLGSGPGEFRLPHWLGRCGMLAVGVYDAANSSLTLLSEKGSLIRRLRLPPNLNFASPVRCARPEDLTLLLNRSRERVEPGQRLMIPTVVVRIVDSARIDTVSRGGTQEIYVARSVPAYSEVPLGRATLAASGRTHLFVAENDEDVVNVLSQEGSLVRRIRLGLSRPRMSMAYWERAVKDRVAAEPLEPTRKLLVAVLDELTAPRKLPAIQRIVADASDNVWIQTYDGFNTEHSIWIVVTARGVPLARAVMPRRLRVVEIGDEYLLGVYKDADDVEQVRLYQFGRLSSRVRGQSAEMRSR